MFDNKNGAPDRELHALIKEPYRGSGQCSAMVGNWPNLTQCPNAATHRYESLWGSVTLRCNEHPLLHEFW